MNIEKEREAFEAWCHVDDQFCTHRYSGSEDYSDDYAQCAWLAWQAQKAQAVPEGFVLLEKKGLRDTYYWDGCEYVVDHPSEYEMELERGEIVTLEKWQRTKETNVYCANIFSDEDNFELVQFDSLEEAEKAVAANKAMIEAQEQSHD